MALIPAYALGALDEEDEAAVEAFLAQDTEAQQQLADYQAITDTLALSALATPAPAHLQDDLKQRLAARHDASTSSDNPDTNRQTNTSTKPTGRSSNGNGRKMQFWALGAVAALVLMVVGGMWVMSLQTTSSAAALYDRLQAQPNAEQIAIQPNVDDLNGTLVIGDDGQQAVFQLVNLPAIDDDQAFQLWLINDDTVISGGVYQFESTAGNHYIRVPLDGSIDQWNQLGISLEPATGSPYPDRPTGKQILGVSLRGA